MLSLLLLIILFVLLSQLVGHVATFYFSNALEKIKYKWPIGFFIILGLIQLVSFPLQYTYASMEAVSVVYTIVLVALCIGAVFTLYRMSPDQRKAIFKFKSECWLEYLLIGGFIFFNFIICFSTNSFNDTNADQSFYITLVENNISAAQINMISPLSGKIEPLQSLYIYQGLYLFLTYLTSVFQLDSVVVMAWFVPTLFWIAVALSFINISCYFGLSKKWWMLIASFVTLWVLFDHFDYLVRYNMYGNNIRPLVFWYLTIFYSEYFQKPNAKSLWLCGLLWLGAIAFQSTVLFLGIMLMVSYGIYELFIHRKNLFVPLVFSALPLIIYISLFMKSRGSWIPGIALFTSLFIILGCHLSEKTKSALNQFLYSKLMRLLIIIGISLMMILSILMIPRLNPSGAVSPKQLIEFFLEQYSFKLRDLNSPHNWPIFVLFMMRWIILGINIYAFIRWKHLSKQLKWLLTTQLIIILIFYNPLVCGLISTALTGIVYTRIHDIVMSLVLMSALVVLGFENKTVKFLFVLLPCLAMAFLGLRTIEYLNTEFNQIGNVTTYNHLYRMDQDMIDVSNFLENHVEDGEIKRPLVLTVHMQLNYMAHNYEMLYTVNQDRHLYDESSREKEADLYLLRDVLKKSYEIDEEQLPAFVQIINEYGVNYIMTQQDMSPFVLDVLGSKYDLIYENPSYRLYHVRK